ncbi:MAG TPA: hypothetical protein VIM03_02805 [Thermoleophilaceae bacterium]
MSGAELVHQVNCRLARLAWIASAVGAIFVFNSIGFLIPIFLDPHERTRLALTNAPVIIAYLVVFGFLIRRHTARHLQRTLRWIVEDREPDEGEHRRTLSLALYGVKFAPYSAGSQPFPCSAPCPSRPSRGDGPPWSEPPSGAVARPPAR